MFQGVLAQEHLEHLLIPEGVTRMGSGYWLFSGIYFSREHLEHLEHPIHEQPCGDVVDAEFEEVEDDKQ